MTVTIAPVGSLTPTKIGALLDPLVLGAAGELVILNLQRISFVTPFGFVTLVSILDHVHSTTGGVRLVCPADEGCRQYFSASGFLQHLPPDIEVAADDGLRGARPSDAETLLPLTRLHREQDIETARRRLEARFDELLGSDTLNGGRTKGAVRTTLVELCTNIFQHAHIGVGWVAAQKYFNRYQRRQFVEIGVADAGRGIRRSLATTHPDIGRLSDGRAILRTLQEGLSRRANGGTGFQVLQDATRELDGSFYLRSGSGAVERARRRRGLRLNEHLIPWPGTQLRVKLTCR